MNQFCSESRALRGTIGPLIAVSLLLAPGAMADGGISPNGTPGDVGAQAGAKARLASDGQAIAPAAAPRVVKEVIAAANKIEDKPYIYGGGHGSFRDKGYDCSGAASFALHGGRLLDAPIDSTGMSKFGVPGKGRWISVYGAPSHGYLVVAGLRFDTSMTPGNGPGWSTSMRSTPENYRVRHPEGL